MTRDLAYYVGLMRKEPRPIRKKSTDQEGPLQASIVSALRVAFPKVWVFAVPNGGKRAFMTGVKLKKQGVMAGVPDLGLIMESGCQAWIEVKSGKITDSSLSPAQKAFRDMCRERDIPWACVNSVADALETVKGWPV